MMIYFLYYFLALLVAIAAVAILFTSQPFLATIYLVSIVLGLSAIYFLQGASLVAILQLILHAGGILVLLICSLLLFKPQASSTNNQVGPYHKIAALGVLLLLVGVIGWKLYATPGSWVSPPTYPTANTVAAISYQLIGDYGLVLELVGILILVTLVGVLYVLMKNNG
jgi:NADH-quinone oxidoreductase subunit J